MTRSVAWLGLALLVACAPACRESYTFTPRDTAGLIENVLALLDRPGVRTRTLAAGRSASEPYAGLVREGEPPVSFVYVFDWGSAANHLTFALHRQGDATPLNFSGSITFDCSLPSDTGPANAPLQKPLCPLVLSNTTTDKPKLLEIKDLAPGTYGLVMTNNGPGNETIRWTGIQ